MKEIGELAAQTCTLLNSDPDCNGVTMRNIPGVDLLRYNLHIPTSGVFVDFFNSPKKNVQFLAVIVVLSGRRSQSWYYDPASTTYKAGQWARRPGKYSGLPRGFKKQKNEYLVILKGQLKLVNMLLNS